MDTSKKYILMCEKAEEIQKIWRRKIGDLYCGYNSIMMSVNAGWESDGTISYSSANVKFIKYCPKKLVWLPRQDQLQEMITNKGYFGFSLIELFYYFANEWHRKKGGFTSMEQLWLAFVMKEKYKKTWDGKEWVK